MRVKRNLIIGVTLLVLLVAPTAVAESGGWALIEERLGFVESDVDELESENAALKERVADLEYTVAGQSLLMLRVQSRLTCVEEALRGYGKCRQRVLLRR